MPRGFAQRNLTSLLSSSDLSKVLSAVELLNSGTGMDTLPGRTLRCVLSLIPNEMAIFDGFDSSGEYSGYHWYSPPGCISGELIKRLGELIHDHPIYKNVLAARKETTFRISEFVSLPEFHRTPLFNDVYRAVGGDAQMGTTMQVSPQLYVTHSLYREGHDFTELECEMLRLITPHLKAAFRNARAIDQLEGEKRYLSAAVTKGIVVLDSEGNVVFQSEFAGKLLGKYFQEREANGLPSFLNHYLRKVASAAVGKDYYRPPEPLRFVERSGELKVDIALDANRRELTLVFDEKISNSPGDYICLGLTPRESEILCWISKGKTNPEIAILCEISPRTVHKHVENILTKLGVETRMAAVRYAESRNERG